MGGATMGSRVTVTFWLILGAGLLSGCFDFDLNQREYYCDKDSDCVDGWECRLPANHTKKVCVPKGGAVELDCGKVFYSATGLTLTVHMPDGTTQRVQVPKEGLDPDAWTTTPVGALFAIFHGAEYPLQVVVDRADTVVKAKLGDCPFQCVGLPDSQYNPVSCNDNDCDMYGEGPGCRGEDTNDDDPAVFPGAPEICDGADNDGDSLVDGDDPDYAAPSCPKQVGVCRGAVKACIDGVLQPCDYGPSYAPEETIDWCDGLDNDCDNRVDEECPCRDGQEEPCGSVLGECQRGTRRCVNGRWGPCEGSVDPVPEVCDGLDNDCDGITDELPDNDAGHVCGENCPDWNTVPIVAEINGSMVTICVDRWEETRRDPDNPNSNFPESRPDAPPWTNVSFADAQTACILAGKRLCPIEIWSTACGGRDRFGDGYPYGAAYQEGVCNGNNVGQAPEPTGTRAGCVSTWDGRGGNDSAGLLFDMSGNVKEWVEPPQGENGRWTMGGSYASPPDQLTCVAREQHHDGEGAPDIGFRCCSPLP